MHRLALAKALPCAEKCLDLSPALLQSRYKSCSAAMLQARQQSQHKRLLQNKCIMHADPVQVLLGPNPSASACRNSTHPSPPLLQSKCQHVEPLRKLPWYRR